MSEERYYLNNKIYNISKSVELYQYIKREPSGLMFAGRYPVTREVKYTVYKSPKGNLFETIGKSGKIAIIDINKKRF